MQSSESVRTVDRPWVDLFEDRYGVGSFARLMTHLNTPCTSFADIAALFGVTRERVRQWHLTLLPAHGRRISLPAARTRPSVGHHFHRLARIEVLAVSEYVSGCSSRCGCQPSGVLTLDAGLGVRFRMRRSTTEERRTRRKGGHGGKVYECRLVRRGGEVATRRSAKPSFEGSSPSRASNFL
jgi:hypothetical protein